MDIKDALILLNKAVKIVSDGKLIMKDLYQKLPPIKNLKSVDGMFIVPFVLKEWDLDEDFDTANKIKAIIAHDPNSVFAIAYRIGVYDERAGKTESQRINKHRSVDKILKDDLGLDCGKLRKEYKLIENKKLLNSGDNT